MCLHVSYRKWGPACGFPTEGPPRRVPNGRSPNCGPSRGVPNGRSHRKVPQVGPPIAFSKKGYHRVVPILGSPIWFTQVGFPYGVLTKRVTKWEFQKRGPSRGVPQLESPKEFR